MFNKCVDTDSESACMTQHLLVRIQGANTQNGKFNEKESKRGL